MKHFPMALYICPGTEQLESGLFTTRLAHDEDDRDAALAAGWHTCQEDAKAAYDAELADIEAEKKAAVSVGTVGGVVNVNGADVLDSRPDDQVNVVPPSRAELETQARDLGVEFSPKLGDKKLAERIAAKLAEKPAD